MLYKVINAGTGDKMIEIDQFLEAGEYRKIHGDYYSPNTRFEGHTEANGRQWRVIYSDMTGETYACAIEGDQ
ncbi:hypothetical protein D3C72_1660840 [compost metagenome]